MFAARNKEDSKARAVSVSSAAQTTLAIPPALASDALALRSLPEDSEGDIAQREEAFQRVRANPELTRYELAADLYTAAFLLPKVKPAPGKESNPEFPGMPLVPVSSHVWRVLQGGQVLGHLSGPPGKPPVSPRLSLALEFPHILLNQNEDRRGFDIVLGNPPWERIKLQEQEFFAPREPAIRSPERGCPRTHDRCTQIRPDWSHERACMEEFEVAKPSLKHGHLRPRLCRRNRSLPADWPRDVNTYALFAELFSQLVNRLGRAGVIVPTGIATDVTTAPFFASLVVRDILVCFYSFENEALLFPRFIMPSSSVFWYAGTSRRNSGAITAYSRVT